MYYGTLRRFCLHGCKRRVGRRGMPTSILDLPTELILEIIHSDDSTDATIAYLGMTCRRLHGICQVLVLQRQLPVLRALASDHRLLIYKNSASSIAMKEEEFNDVKEIFHGSFHKIEYVQTFTVKEIPSVYGLIFHANTVGHINIRLDFYLGSLAKKKSWYKSLASLIRVSSEKDMASLTIKGLPRDEELGYFETPSSPGKDYFSIFGLLKNRFFHHKTRSGGIGTQPIRQVGAPEIGSLPITDGTPRGLKSFEIHSPLAFHTELFPQTLRALNGGYLTKLSLRASMSDWSRILPLLSIPLLSEFNVSADCNLPFRDLSPFLLRHSSITHLDLYFIIPGLGPTMPPAGFLPRLEVIRGNPVCLSRLLSRQRDLFPNLHSVALTDPMHGAFQLGALGNILRSLADRKRGTIHLSIPFSDVTGLTEWFFKARLEPCSLDYVKKLEIIASMSLEMCDSFCSWVSGFPYVQELDLMQVVPEDSKIWIWRLEMLWDSCPELQSIRVGVKTYQRPVKAVK
ncbi:hypothetical protein K443DRAFT_683503 [Laccaria amethystina LaAM-08-1]|uniref:F-box domain-containing protein n=1 Tax=Laccaria amethystina LaAM-08-1 TaxID=1095629 RepID=A0A0C9X0C1_9AGAR|nr:hypothetical protein K443DRAFT_683503 [Laccaria amethystina LaAM-08-1]